MSNAATVIDGGEAQQQQFGVAPSRQRGCHRDRWLDLCGHATARQCGIAGTGWEVVAGTGEVAEVAAGGAGEVVAGP